MSDYPATPRLLSRSSLFAACLLVGLSACQRPVAYFQRSPRDVFYRPVPKSIQPPDSATAELTTDSSQSDDPVGTPLPVFYADITPPAESPGPYPAQPTYPVAERLQQHQTNARRLLSGTSETASAPADRPTEAQQPGPRPKAKTGQRKTLREWLGLPPRKKLNWWQRISWQLKASVIVILVAVVFAILGVTVLAIIFGIIGALLLIRGLKKSFKVRRPWF